MSTSTSTRETSITADPDVPIIRIEREFDAPPAAVFRAHTDPELVVRWLGPAAYEIRLERWDCRTGGAYRYVHSGADGEHGFHGAFHEVRPSELIVQTWTWEGEPDAVFLERLVLTDLGGGRTRLTTTSLVDAFATRDALLSSGMEAGARETYDRLAALLAG